MRGIRFNDLGELNSFHSLTSHIFKKDYCQAKCRDNKIVFLSDGEVHCKGHRPSQFIWESAVCDGRIDCIDRSDEDGCHGTNHELDDNLLVKPPFIH